MILDEGLKAYWLEQGKILEELTDEERGRLADLLNEGDVIFLSITGKIPENALYRIRDAINAATD